MAAMTKCHNVICQCCAIHNIVMNVYSFLLFLLSITRLSMCWSHDWYHLITLLLSLSFWHSILSMPITFPSYLAIISDHISYCPMLLFFILSTQPLIYLIIFVPSTFRLIVLYFALFLSDVLLHYLLALFLIVIPTNPSISDIPIGR